MLYPLQIIGNSKILMKAARYVFEKNGSNNLPYHNLNHTLQMFKYANILLKHGPQITHYDKLLVSIGAMFHDFNYDIKKTDENRIKEAKLGLAEFIRHESIEDMVDAKQISQLIDATQYPYIIAVEELTYLQKIMRDADLMMVFEPNFVHQIIFGLSSEMGITVAEFLPKQKLFLENAAFTTIYGREFRNMHWPFVMKEFEMLEIIYNYKN